jgi:hypothetical protein
MKKRILTGLLFALGIAAQAQTQEFRPEWNFGINAGVTLSQVAFSPSVPQEWLQQNTNGGLTARYISENNCGVQLELNYTLRGWKEKTDTVLHPNRYARSLAYLEMPLLTHFYFNAGRYVRVALNLGPQVSLNIGEKTLMKEVVTSTGYEYYDQKVQRPFDYGITGGLGLELRTGIGSFVLEGRYYYGLSDVFRNGKEDRFQSSHNSVIGIKLTYLTRFTGRKRP